MPEAAGGGFPLLGAGRVRRFESVEAAIRTYESAEYRKAAAVIEGKVERDLRIVEGA